ncbi:MAG: DUF1841 family protein [Betaproteobacteria bacterium]|nr:DUF1841 family protein [Betaproteobacteria bacterium]
MFNPTRDQVRQFFIDAWRKERERQPLSPLEDLAVGVVQLHPEYLGALEGGEAALARDYPPEQGETNPFLHLSLHLAIEEQMSIDQPPGIRKAFDVARARLGDNHRALHVLLDCLAETVWRAERDHKAPDGLAYLECVRRGSDKG